MRAVNGGDHPTDISYRYTGTVVDPHGENLWYTHVQRDDGMTGTGYNSSWLCSDDDLELLVDAPSSHLLASAFTEGDRVENILDGSEGEVVGFMPNRDGEMLVAIKRDDGVRGSTWPGAWLTPPDKLRLLKPKAKHVMGLDPEQFDWEAHKVFIKGL